MKVEIRDKYGEGVDCVMRDFWSWLPTWQSDAGVWEVCLGIVEIDDDPALERLVDLCQQYLALSDQKRRLAKLGNQPRVKLEQQFREETRKLSERFKKVAESALTGAVSVFVSSEDNPEG